VEVLGGNGNNRAAVGNPGRLTVLPTHRELPQQATLGMDYLWKKPKKNGSELDKEMVLCA
jgi:hypothetical protein